MSQSLLLIFGFAILIVNCAEVLGDNDCDKLGILIYEDIGCKPVKKPGLDCPIKYDCDLAIRNNSCLFRGQEFPVGQALPEDLTYGNCNVGCYCRGGLPAAEDLDKLIKNEPVSVAGDFQCAILDCPEWLGASPLGLGCHRTYKLDSCCSSGQLCPNHGTEIGVCEVDGKKYLEGQKFYPRNTCMKCICPKNFNGKYESPHCMRVKCDAQIRQQKPIRDHCAPFYTASEEGPLCCPYSDWICPSESDKIVTINPKADKSSDLTCRFGKKSLKLGEGLESKITYYDSTERKAKCECVLPPFLTCKEVKT